MGGISRHWTWTGDPDCGNRRRNGRCDNVPHGRGEDPHPDAAEPRCPGSRVFVEACRGTCVDQREPPAAYIVSDYVESADTLAADLHGGCVDVSGPTGSASSGYLVFLDGSQDDLPDGGAWWLVPRCCPSWSVDQHPEWNDAGHVPILVETAGILRQPWGDEPPLIERACFVA